MTTQKITTPKAALEWVTITGEGKENLSGKMQYVANAVVPADSPVVASIKAFWEANKPKGFKKDAKSLGIYPHNVPTDEKDEDGKVIYKEDPDNVVLAFKTGTTYASGDPKIINIYNAKGRKVALPEGVSIGNGTIGCIAGAMGIYANKSKVGTVIDAGVTFYLNDIQIIKLVEYTQDAGFDAHDDEDEAWDGEPEFGGEEADDSAAKPRI